MNASDDDINLPTAFPVEVLKAAASALIKAISSNKSAALIIDCDADGMTSSAILVNYLYKLFPFWTTNHLKWFLHSGKQHGLVDMMESIDFADLIICPDSSSNDYECHKILKDKGKTILILDHHEAEKISEDAITINNQLCEYPNKSLSGAGVTWQFCRYLDELLHKDIADSFIDLVALGLVSDMMDIREIETAYLIHKGFYQKNIRNPFIVGMFEKNSYSLKDKITPIGCAFYITPFVNAVMRSGTQEEKELLFKSMLEHWADTKIPSNKRGHKAGEQETILTQVLRMVTNVKTRQKNAEDEGIQRLEDKISDEGLLEHSYLMFLIQPGLERGVDASIRGLCANKFANKYQRPTFVLTGTIQYPDISDIPPWEDLPEDANPVKIYSGSVRGYTKNGILNFKDLCQASGLTEYCTGHQNAFGIAIKEENLDAFMKYLDEAMSDTASTEPVYFVDFLSDKTSVDPNAILEIGRYEDLWGQELEEPLFGIMNLNINENMVTLLSRDKNPTLKITLPNGISIMKFKSNEEEYMQFMGPGYRTVNIVGTANINNYRGEENPQILLKDYEIIGYNKYDF